MIAARYHLQRLAHHSAEALRLFDEGEHDAAFLDFHEAKRHANAVAKLHREAASEQRRKGSS